LDFGVDPQAQVRSSWLVPGPLALSGVGSPSDGRATMRSQARSISGETSATEFAENVSD
jgi:hypothetical protein